MIKKLKCVIVDDEFFMLEAIKDLCKDSKYVESVAAFQCPEKFLKSVHNLDFDICLLDIMMEPMNGFAVAKRLKNKQVVFITGMLDKIPDALDFSPVDVIRKPIDRFRFENAMKKAYYFLAAVNSSGMEQEQKTHELFLVAEQKGRVKVPLQKIIYVKTDNIDHRNKMIYLSDGRKYTIMDYSFEDLIELSPQLVQSNISELISIDIVNDIESNAIFLKTGISSVPHCVALGRAYKKKFLQRVAYA